ncbi:MAG: diaminopimelate epimerase [Gammaproteobacteria bacterium]|nr:diaminopimelate epimerase [Gammaproteobacteria bacterium]NNJ49297.1 diaminopimelate epimerase [Gammaproteobacteria bacterium]
MEIKFTKMHGLGNDFVVIDAITQTIDLTVEQIVAISDRHLGVGCDQLLLVEKPTTDQAEFRYRIYNSDGGEVEQCGNGARCFALFVRQHGLTTSSTIPVETAGGLIELRIEGNQVVVNMGVPDFRPQSLPFLVDYQAESYNLMVNGAEYAIGAVSMGNPHAVMPVEDVDTVDIETLGKEIESHPQFPNRVNAGFMQVVKRDEIRLRVYERGAGETRACGTGACAAVAVGRSLALLDERVTVHLPGGDLMIEWPGEGRALLMTGPATTVFEGKINI